MSGRIQEIEVNGQISAPDEENNMSTQDKTKDVISLFVPHSYLTTESNKTGAWRFLRPLYDEKTAPCSAVCPAGEDIGRIEMLTAQGLFKEAWETILKENPFPAVCGRVCYHPCEKQCNRGEFDEAIGIHSIERFLADTAARYELKPALDRLSPKNLKIAVVGAGPAGLAAAYFLTRLGYGCDVFEAAPEPGGILRFGIPGYRMPVAVLRAEIEQIGKTGFGLYCGKNVTKTFLEEIQGKYDAVFLGCGHSQGSRLDITGGELEGVEDGLQFLQRVNRGETPESFDGPVAVVGGGNTAVDVARTVLRLGGRPVLIYRRRREDMPAFEDEIGMALEEGVQLLELWTPMEIERQGEEYVLTLRQMRAVETGSRRRAGIEPVDPPKTQTLRVSHIFKAIGLEAAREWYNPPDVPAGVIRLSNSVLVYSGVSAAVVYGGDLVSEIKSVVHAVASGKEASMALDTFFQEGPDAVLPKLETCRVGNGSSLSMEVYMQGPQCGRNRHVVTYGEINTDHFQFSPKVAQPRLLVEERIRSFAEIDLRISASLAMKEAARCFNCGLCNQCDNCRLYCPDLAVTREDTARGHSINYDYCKGCGICVVECPRNAMSLEKE